MFSGGLRKGALGTNGLNVKFFLDLFSGPPDYFSRAIKMKNGYFYFTH